jgi:hypothetical protein
LVAADDIEPGDAIEVQLEDGTTTAMVFLSASGGSVKLLGQDGKTRRYSVASLEELKGDSFIVGKSEEELDAKEILANARG